MRNGAACLELTDPFGFIATSWLPRRSIRIELPAVPDVTRFALFLL
jgi:hypothetical protein